ncbi:NAD(P)/FAD-dependent oxidoreductase [Clostridioides difficile]|nr:NAD(P)/FAD-dependent oxidoreductase [Clostridioides difficile]
MKISRRFIFAGEVIDIDAYTGGFNLQIAFLLDIWQVLIAKNYLN